MSKKGEGTFSEVLKAQCIKNGKYVAMKCMKSHFDSIDQVNNLREIQALRRLSPHQNIIKLMEVLYDQPTGRLALVFELMDMNIYELIRGRRHYVAEDRVKNYMYQLVNAMDHRHRNGIFHRDIKPENILIMDDCLKLADFGSCRGIYSKQPYTEYISTRWYRAPECLLTDGYYNYKMDMWGVGCVFFEIVSLFPLFPGTNELDQIQKIHNVLGTPSPELLNKLKRRSQHMDFNFPNKEGTGIQKLIPHASPDCIELITKLLAYNPEDRLSARQALRHPYFGEIRESEKRHQSSASHGGSLSSTRRDIASPTEARTERRRAGKQSSGYGESSGSELPEISVSGKPKKGHKEEDKENSSGGFGRLLKEKSHTKVGLVRKENSYRSTQRHGAGKPGQSFAHALPSNRSTGRMDLDHSEESENEGPSGARHGGGHHHGGYGQSTRSLPPIASSISMPVVAGRTLGKTNKQSHLYHNHSYVNPSYTRKNPTNNYTRYTGKAPLVASQYKYKSKSKSKYVSPYGQKAQKAQKSATKLPGFD